MSIKDDATTLLIRLAQLQQTHPTFRTEYIDGPDLDKLLQMGPTRLSDAVAFLEESGYLEALKTFGTAPYEFNSVMLTSRGRFEAERLIDGGSNPTNDPRQAGGAEATVSNLVSSTVTRLAQPIGSPFGFNSPDWERVSLDHEDAGRLVVVLGHQSDSKYFDSGQLHASIKAEFESALAASLPRIRRPVSLDFRVLGAGYGGHLFNQIARDIISSDIAVFETSI